MAIGPVVAPVGTGAVICVSASTARDVALVPLKVTLVAPVKPDPEMTTLVPTAPLVGENDEIVGAAAAAGEAISMGHSPSRITSILQVRTRLIRSPSSCLPRNKYLTCCAESRANGPGSTDSERETPQPVDKTVQAPTETLEEHDRLLVKSM
jgi:hypothetical protein